MTTKGDLLTTNGSTDLKLGVGNNDDLLIADSSTASGLKWGRVAGFYNFTMGADNQNYYKVDVTSYETVRRFIFRGTDIDPVTKSKIVINTANKNSDFDVRVIDITNSNNVIAQFPQVSNDTNITIQSDTSLTNLPTSEAVFDIQGTLQSNKGDGYIYYFSMD